MIIGIPTPNNYFCPWQTVKCLLSVAEEYEIVSISGPYIYMNRNILFDIAKKENQSILMIDADMVFTLEDVRKIELLLDSHDIVSGLYVMGQPPHPECVFKRTEDNYILTKPPETFDEIDATGGGFLGMSANVVQTLHEPFTDIWEGKEKHGEDISFCKRATDHGFKIWLDPSIRLGHIRHAPLYPQIRASGVV